VSTRRHATVLFSLLLLTITSLAVSATVPIKPKLKSAAHSTTSTKKSTLITSSHAKATATPSKKTAGDINSFIPFYNAGIIDYRAEHYAEAEKNLRQALKLVRQFNPPNSANQAYVNQMLAASLYKELDSQPERLAEPKPYIETALILLAKPDVAKTIPSKTLTTMKLGLLPMQARIAMLQGDYALADQAIRAALPLAETENGTESEQAKVLRRILVDLGKITTGPDYLEDSPLKRVTHWTKPKGESIAVWIDDGSQVPGWSPAQSEAVRQAYMDWQNSLEGIVQFSWAKSPEEADTLVHWSPAVISASKAGIQGEVGEQLNGYCRTSILESEMVLARQEIVLSVADRQQKPNTPNRLHTYALHEIGHSLGLESLHSNNPGDIMYSSDSYDNKLWRKPSARDIATMKRLYQLTPQVTNPPGIPLEGYAQFLDLRRQAAEAYNAHDYAVAEQMFTKALELYVDVPTHYYLGTAQVELQKYNLALPHLFYAANTPNKQQGDAVQMAAYTLVHSAQKDLQAGQEEQARQKLNTVQPFLAGHLQHTPLSAEQAVACQKMLNNVNQVLATGLITANSATALSNASEAAAPPAKRKGIFRFLDPLPQGSYYQDRLPYNLPGSMRSF
jgi:predicted Zn-dependent protease